MCCQALMTEVLLHRQFRHFSELPYSQRVLYTGALLVLGLGYLFALIYLFHTYAGKGTGNPMMLSYDDVVVAYSGSGKASRLESALSASMSTMLPRDELNQIVQWVKAGADRSTYDREIRPILDKRCMRKARAPTGRAVRTRRAISRARRAIRSCAT